MVKKEATRAMYQVVAHTQEKHTNTHIKDFGSEMKIARFI